MYQFKTAAPVNTVDFAHNDYLQMTAELGIPGVLLLAALVVMVVGRTLTVVFRAPKSPHWYLACGLLGSFCAIAVHSLADFNLYVPANALAFAWLAGLSTALSPTSGGATCHPSDRLSVGPAGRPIGLGARTFRGIGGGRRNPPGQ
jgi:O-antigen ligase